MDWAARWSRTGTRRRRPVVQQKLVVRPVGAHVVVADLGSDLGVVAIRLLASLVVADAVNDVHQAAVHFLESVDNVGL